MRLLWNEFHLVVIYCLYRSDLNRPQAKLRRCNGLGHQPLDRGFGVDALALNHYRFAEQASWAYPIAVAKG